MTQMSHAEQMDIITKALAAAQAGDHQEELRLAHRFPLSPHLAKAAKEIFGRGGAGKNSLSRDSSLDRNCGTFKKANARLAIEKL